MQKDQGKILCSGTDLVHFLECPHLTSLDLINMETPLAKAPVDEQARLIGEKGSQHEKAYLQKLKQSGVHIADLSAVKGDRANRVKETLKAMESGAELIYQGALSFGNLTGQADFLKKVKLRTRFGDYGYEVMDAKLAHLPRVEFIIQLCFYTDLLSEAQGAEPRLIHLIAGDGTEQNFRTADFSRYYRFIKANFLQKVTASPEKTYPDRCDYCTLCHWKELCKEKWLEDDHLNQVAGITRIQIKKLQNAGMNTMEALAKVNEGSKIQKMGDATLQKLKSQSGLQVEKRNTGDNRYKILPLDPEGLRGFCRLPPPGEGDLFFDMEGDPLQTNGLEYLFGVYYLEKGQPRSKEFWAHNRHEEKLAFEAFIDFVMARLKIYPLMSVYHYASYEETALKKLMSIHGTREAEVDHLLRSRKLVDLYKVVREGMMVSEPSYSLKNLEVFYMEKREGEVKDAGASIVYYERWRETREDDLLKKIGLYNLVDCRSLYLLREWLLKLRPSEIPWFSPENEKELLESDPVKSDLEERLAHYETSLLPQQPEDPGEGAADHAMRQLVFHLLDYYRREAKPAWWKLFSRQEMTVEELMEDPECIGGMRRDLSVKKKKKKRSLVYTY
ncbi:MAG: TM0106 family RecB-like putative nuclease, partial [Nitrospirae bacterium]|nr:TM0106 family RecB-like putative nuclease [Nitrospirota bacterium]